ncbi:MAG: hypothetical protein R3A80_04165 [Bdellovibrionota bacterium]
MSALKKQKSTPSASTGKSVNSTRKLKKAHLARLVWDESSQSLLEEGLRVNTLGLVVFALACVVLAVGFFGIPAASYHFLP